MAVVGASWASNSVFVLLVDMGVFQGNLTGCGSIRPWLARSAPDWVALVREAESGQFELGQGTKAAKGGWTRREAVAKLADLLSSTGDDRLQYEFSSEQEQTRVNERGETGPA